MCRGATSLRAEFPQLRLSGPAHFGYGGSSLLYPLLVTEDLRQTLLAYSADSFSALAFWPAAPGSIRQLFPAPAFTVPGSLISEVMLLLAPFMALCALCSCYFGNPSMSGVTCQMRFFHDDADVAPFKLQNLGCAPIRSQTVGYGTHQQPGFGVCTSQQSEGCGLRHPTNSRMHNVTRYTL